MAPVAVTAAVTSVEVAAVKVVAPTEVDVKDVKPVQPDVLNETVDAPVTTAVSIPLTVAPTGAAIAKEPIPIAYRRIDHKPRAAHQQPEKKYAGKAPPTGQTQLPIHFGDSCGLRTLGRP